MSDVHFEMGNAGTLSEHVGGGPVVNIPVGEERGEIAALPSAPPMLHNAPGGRRGVSSFRYQPGEGGGELAGRAKAGHHMTSGHIDVNGTGVGEEAVMAAAVDGHGKGIAGQGFEIGGPVGDRKVVRRRLPEYPAWAEEKGISAMVKIYFTVRPDGSIRSTMRILRSSGYAELDSLAKDALANWRFSPTSARSTTEEAWGVITFRFTLA
jgi:TonB family protein